MPTPEPSPTPGFPNDNTNRQAILDYVTERPGATFREVLRRTGIAAGTARHHLSVLARCGLLREERHHQTLRFFRSDSRFATDWPAYVVLRQKEMKQLHDWVLANPWRMQKDLLDAAEDWGWSRSTTQHRLNRLVKEELVEEHERGRCKVYVAREVGGQVLPDRERLMHPILALRQAQAAAAVP